MATIERNATCVVEMAKLADAALLARKLRKRGTGTMFSNAMMTSTGSLVGGNYRDFVSVPLSGSVTFPESFAIPYETIASAAKGARKQIVTIGHGFLHREDGERFEWEPEDKPARFFEEMLEDAVTLLDDHVKVGFAAQDFIECVEATYGAALKNDGRPSLHGIAIVSVDSAPDPSECPADHITYDFVATDAYRMHAARTTGTYDAHYTGLEQDPPRERVSLQGQLELIIPADPMHLVGSVKNAQRVYVIANKDAQALLVKGPEDSYVTIHTLYGAKGYPNYESLFEIATDPSRMAAEVAVDTNRMLDALAAACADAKNNNRRGEPVRIRINRDEMLLEAPGGDDQQDPYVVRLLPDTVYGDHATPDTIIELGVNGHFLHDAVQSMGSDTTLIRFTCRDGKYEAPIYLTGTEAYNVVDGYGERCIVMPMRA